MFMKTTRGTLAVMVVVKTRGGYTTWNTEQLAASKKRAATGSMASS